MRKVIIAGNWKMYKTISETEEYFNSLKDKINTDTKEVILFTPFLDILKAKELTENTNIKIGAQNMHFESCGAYTGEISPCMLKEIGVECVLIGHSERRKYFNETNESVNLKMKTAICENMFPMMCVGEDIDQRENDLTFDVIKEQLSKGLNGIESSDFAIAYEPIWAIGTGKTATDEQAEEVCAFIRKCLCELGFAAETIRILYGGSVNPTNISSLMAKENIDGALVGGASLKETFAEIVNY